MIMISLLVRGNTTCQITVYLCMCYMLIHQLYQQVQSCDIDIEEEFWSLQWYLNKSESDKYDMNVLPAWRSCINGTGVTVGVVDKGVQDHVDLNINRHIGFGEGNSTVQSLQHGTRVAGVIGALKNGKFIVGVAFGSALADIKIASSSSATFETFDVAALVHHTDIIDVYSCSFSNFHTGTKTYPLLEEQENAFEIGTSSGRGGLGSVYVFATGNSGDESDFIYDSCAYDRLVTNRYVISVAGIQNDLSKVQSGEACSAMMVTAFTAKAGALHHKIVTTDVGNSSTEYFNQNSAATPFVSGAVALAISANPSLSYRDVMHLLVLTSRADLPELQHGNYFMKNAANLSVSSYFGFGLLDIGALVEQSMVWRNVPSLKNCSVNSPNNNAVGSSYHIVHVNACDITYAEHVEVSLKINHQNAGQIQWDLVSPYGTRSTILPGREYDDTSYMDLTVLTVQMWGENPNGYWKLEPKARFQADLDVGSVESFRLDIHGFTCMPDVKCLQPAIQEPPVDTTTLTNVTVEADHKIKDPSNKILIAFAVILLILIFVVVGVCVSYKKKLGPCWKENVRSHTDATDHKMEYI